MSIIDKNSKLAAVIKDVAAVAGYIWQKGWGERNGGNITVDITNLAQAEWADYSALCAPIAIGCTLPALSGRYFYAKGTQKRMRDLAQTPMENGAVIHVSKDGAFYEIIADDMVMPTSELPSHLIVQNYLRTTGSRYTATLHTHPIELVAMSHLTRFKDSDIMTRTLWSMIPETLAFAPLGIGWVPYQLPGSMDLAQATLRQIEKYDVTMWEKHGVFAVGQDIMDAFDQIDVLNKAANIYMCARAMGDEPEGLTEQAIREVQNVFNLPKKRPC